MAPGFRDEVIPRDTGHVLFEDARFRVVYLKRGDGVLLDFDTSDDTKAGSLEAGGQSTGTAENVYSVQRLGVIAYRHISFASRLQ